MLCGLTSSYRKLRRTAYQVKRRIYLRKLRYSARRAREIRQMEILLLIYVGAAPIDLVSVARYTGINGIPRYVKRRYGIL
jgi:hypothetical protein